MKKLILITFVILSSTSLFGCSAFHTNKHLAPDINEAGRNCKNTTTLTGYTYQDDEVYISVTCDDKNT